jgi:hypothetical protein
MLGFKSFGNAAVAISGIELAQEIRKVQFDTSAMTTKEGTRVPQVWDVVLAT